MLSRERLLAVLPEIQEVENPQWRESCIAIWTEAFEESCWEDILDAPNSPDCPDDSLVRHTRGVLKGALALARTVQEFHPVSIHYDKLRVICLVHDVCKIVELEKDENGYHKSKLGTDFPHGYYSGYYCMKHGLPSDIVAAVTSHSQFVKNVPDCIEGVLQFYADMADAEIPRILNHLPLLMHYCKI